MRQILVAASLAFTLTGCALPPAIGVASLAVDVASYFFSGKTLSDHGISAVAQQDCALIRVMQGELCEEYTDFEVADAVLEPLSPADEIEIAEVSNVDSSVSYFSEDAQLGAVDPNAVSPYSQEIAAIDARTNHLEIEVVELDYQTAEFFEDAAYLADEVNPVGFGG
ncbi:hypothetical protein [Kiloniella antarctica]|uniref:Uncharacterized protein n=1 Tax=Kiloniella antarctica TaxID=1550907 RepID=A0ABW5BNV2_9PROT